jgi:hypothetical protein
MSFDDNKWGSMIVTLFQVRTEPAYYYPWQPLVCQPTVRSAGEIDVVVMKYSWLVAPEPLRPAILASLKILITCLIID